MTPTYITVTPSSSSSTQHRFPHLVHSILIFLISLSSLLPIHAQITDYTPLEHTELGIISSLPGQPTWIQPIFSPDNGMHVLVRLIQE